MEGAGEYKKKNTMTNQAVILDKDDVLFSQWAYKFGHRGDFRISISNPGNLVR